MFSFRSLLILSHFVILSIGCTRGYADKKENIKNDREGASTYWKPDDTGLLLLDQVSVDLSHIKSEEMTWLNVKYSNLTWNSTEPIGFPDLKTFALIGSRINPHSIKFSDKLRSLTIDNVTLINGTIEDLFKRTGANLQRLTISTTDNFDVKLIPIEKLRSISFYDCNLTWNNRDSIYFQNLESITIDGTRINPHSITFSDKLNTFEIVKPTFINGTIADLFKTVTNLETLMVGDLDTIDVSLLPADTLRVLEIRQNCIFTWNNPHATVALLNLEHLSIRESQISPQSVRFSDKLTSINIYSAILVNGTLSQLLETATNVEVLKIQDMGNISLNSLPIKNVQELEIKQNITITWNSDEDEPTVLENLQYLIIFETRIDSHSVKFSNKLKSFDIAGLDLINGTIYDLLETASNLEGLSITDTNPIDISKISSSQTLKALNIVSPRVYFSDQSTFRKLDSLKLGQNHYLDDIKSWNFSTTFPSIRTFDVSVSFTASPELVLYFLRLPLPEFWFIFDLNPEIKSFDFGAVVKLLLNNGFSKHIHQDFFSRPDDFPNSRFQVIHIHKHLLENGSYAFDVEPFNTFLPWEFHGAKTFEKAKPLKQKILTFLYFSFLAIFLFIGIIGNSVSALVLARNKMRNHSSGQILLSLTIYDSVVLVTYTMSSVLNVSLFYAVFVTSSIEFETSYFLAFTPEEHVWMAKKDWVQANVLYPLNKTAYTGSVYTTVLISLERFIAICWPLKSRHLLSTRNVKISILVVFGIAVTVNLTRWFESYEWNLYSEASTTWNEFYKPMLMRMESYRKIYHGFVWAIAMYILPFCLMGGLNFKLGQQIIKANRARRALQNSESSSSTKEAEEEASVTKMLLCVVAVFVVCNSIHIAIVFYFLVAYEQIELSTIEAISCLPLIVNSSANFLIYIVMGKTLRCEFFKLIPKCLKPTKVLASFELSGTSRNHQTTDSVLSS